MIKQNPNLLWRTRTYLVGNMEANPAMGAQWRKRVTPALQAMGIIVFNPYDKPFLKDIKEGEETIKKNSHLRETGDFDTLSIAMKETRIFDLNLVDRSDFIFAHITPDVASWGSAEEIFTANYMKKPIFLSVEGGKKCCPIWLFGTFPHKYIYDSPEDILIMLQKIDNGEIVCDSTRWRLLRKDYR